MYQISFTNLNKMTFCVSCRNVYEMSHSILEEEFVVQINIKIVKK